MLDEDNNLFIIIFVLVNNGMVIINVDNILIYILNVGFEGIDMVIFIVLDGDGGIVEG